MQRRVVHALSPFAGDLRRLLIRPGGGRCKAELLGKPRRKLLVRGQMPRLPHWATPATGVRVLSVINDELYLSELAVQGQGSAAALL